MPQAALRHATYSAHRCHSCTVKFTGAAVVRVGRFGPHYLPPRTLMEMRRSLDEPSGSTWWDKGRAVCAVNLCCQVEEGKGCPRAGAICNGQQERHSRLPSTTTQRLTQEARGLGSRGCNRYHTRSTCRTLRTPSRALPCDSHKRTPANSAYRPQDFPLYTVPHDTRNIAPPKS